MSVTAAPAARLLLRPHVQGLRHVPRSGPVILASNHLSFADNWVIPAVARRRVVFLAKAEYFDGRGLSGAASRWFFTALGQVPVPRTERRAARGALETALSVLRDGEAFGIFPEGTRSVDGRLYRGHIGVAWLALSSGAPVVPVALHGTDRVHPVGKRVPRPHRIRVRFGAPLDFTSLGSAAAESAKQRRAVTDEVMRSIAALSEQEYVARYNDRAAS